MAGCDFDALVICAPYIGSARLVDASDVQISRMYGFGFVL